MTVELSYAEYGAGPPLVQKALRKYRQSHCQAGETAIVEHEPIGPRLSHDVAQKRQHK